MIPFPWKQWSVVFAASVSLGAVNLNSQSLAEHAVTTAKVGGAVTGTALPKSVVAAAPQKTAASPHLPAQHGEPVHVRNRRALEARAGEDAGQLLLRSVPAGAQLWINGAPVGNSPLLLTLAPGSYVVEMRGERMEISEKQVDLLPKEHRDVVLTLRQRYPARVRLR